MGFLGSLFRNTAYPHMVSNKLFELGLTPDVLIAFGRNDFLVLCKSLKAYDYSEDAAADLIFRMFSGDKKAFDEMYENSTPAGVIALQKAKLFFDINPNNTDINLKP
jgi:hypothetical protein